MGLGRRASLLLLGLLATAFAAAAAAEEGDADPLYRWVLLLLPAPPPPPHEIPSAARYFLAGSWDGSCWLHAAPASIFSTVLHDIACLINIGSTSTVR
jgi:hypothetical protein